MKARRVNKLIEILEQYPDDALVSILTKEGVSFKLKPLEVIYLRKRNQIVFQIDEKKQENE